ncbi:phage virion morphogenesis protein [Escherichia coli]|uniref:phage virion morphogenesis protein n=1 Tax=Escherichia coli TaxID=562 RepID=UPI0015C4CB1A|nr:phage virion morphogenesis protein [Escherichia coli]
MSDALEYQLDHVLQGVLQRTLPAARKTLARELAAGLRSRQAARIRRQQDPDGAPHDTPEAEENHPVPRAVTFSLVRTVRHADQGDLQLAQHVLPSGRAGGYRF